MFDMKFKFSILGVIIFMLPMLINIVYFMVPTPDAPKVELTHYKWVEMVEQITRVLYAGVICILVSSQKINYKSIYLYVGIVFLILYYIVWMRYFLGGMDRELLAKSFLGVPLPLAIFPVLYFICSALWLKNYIAVVIMIIFGIAHYSVSYMSLK